MDEFSELTTYRRPTAARPLLGLTVLVVEDSLFACEALRLLCLRSGARIRRADCLKSARRHLQLYRPSVMIVDMGLPDGSGAELIEEMARSTPRVDVLLASSGDAFSEAEAIAAGADGFLAKPLHDLATFQEAILSRLPAEKRPNGPRLLNEDLVRPDLIAYRDDLCHAAETLAGSPDARELDYVARFLSGIARSAHDTALARAADEITRAQAGGGVLNADILRLNTIVKDRLAREAETAL